LGHADAVSAVELFEQGFTAKSVAISLGLAGSPVQMLYQRWRLRGAGALMTRDRRQYDFGTKFEIVLRHIKGESGRTLSPEFDLPSPSVKMVTDSLRMAIVTLRPDEKPLVRCDQGFQCRHTLWRDTLRGAGLTQSMSRKGACPDNAVMAGFFSHLKQGWFRIQKPETLDEFHVGLTDYLEWWNTTRIQERLGYLSPDQYRAQTPPSHRV